MQDCVLVFNTVLVLCAKLAHNYDSSSKLGFELSTSRLCVEIRTSNESPRAERVAQMLNDYSMFSLGRANEVEAVWRARERTGTKKKVLSYLFGKNCDVFVERFWGANVATGYCRVSRGAGRQLALLEDQGQQGEQWMPGNEPRVIIMVSNSFL